MTDDNEFKPGDYDLSKLVGDSLCAIALLDELRIALPLAEKYKKDECDKGEHWLIFMSLVADMKLAITYLEQSLDAPEGSES